MLQTEQRITDKTIQLTENYRLKYDSTKNKWIEKQIIKVNKDENSEKFGEKKIIWEKYAGYMPTYELLLWDFAIKHTAKAELKSAHDVIEKIAEAEKLVSEFAKKLGKELDR